MQEEEKISTYTEYYKHVAIHTEKAQQSNVLGNRMRSIYSNV